MVSWRVKTCSHSQTFKKHQRSAIKGNKIKMYGRLAFVNNRSDDQLFYFFFFKLANGLTFLLHPSSSISHRLNGLLPYFHCVNVDFRTGSRSEVFLQTGVLNRDGGGGGFLVCEHFGRMFHRSFPACALFIFLKIYLFIY